MRDSFDGAFEDAMFTLHIVCTKVTEKLAPLAQLVERRSHNPEVVSSILTGGIW